MYKTKEQPCWTCTKAYGCCEWSAKDPKPVPGWVAEPTILNKNTSPVQSFKIISCPKYERENRWA